MKKFEFIVKRLWDNGSPVFVALDEKGRHLFPETNHHFKTPVSAITTALNFYERSLDDPDLTGVEIKFVFK